MKIQIISNPYEQKTKYKRWDEEERSWIPVDYEHNPHSSLLRSALTEGFFPFVIEEIVEGLFKEYETGEDKLEIFFEGTSEDYNQLLQLAENPRYADRLEVHMGDRQLENANDVLQEAARVFKIAEPIIHDNPDDSQVQENLNRFKDASSHVIPICVLGNYSTGKSTFINSLIGQEILPAGDMPVTAKIYKITESEQPETASVRFYSQGVKSCIQFNREGFAAESSLIPLRLQNDLAFLQDCQSWEDTAPAISRTLKILNDLTEDIIAVTKSGEDSTGAISELIEIEIPFQGYALAQDPHQFVIFDTPGSNSHSNQRHSEILRSAMGRLTNGLLVFVTRYDALDTMDNESLYESIDQLEALDSRFSMIVVNKADDSDLPEDGFTERDIRMIQAQSVTRNLSQNGYSGIFFVSSRAGMGSKLDGKLTRTAQRNFDKIRSYFEDPDDPYYLQLFNYNLRPVQIKDQEVREGNSHENLCYANSGLYAVESEISRFASQYSYYNKCSQACLFLGNVMERTALQIDQAKNQKISSRDTTQRKLDETKNNLKNAINHKKQKLFLQAQREYEGTEDDRGIKDKIKQHQHKEISRKNTEEIYNHLQREKEEHLKKAAAKGAEKQNQPSLPESKPDRNRSKNDFMNFLDGVGKAATDTFNGVMKWQQDRADDLQKSWQIHNETITAEYDYFKADLKKKSRIALGKMIQESKDFWTAKAKKELEELQKIISKEEFLPKAFREELQEIIQSYDQIHFPSPYNQMADLDDISRIFKVGDLEVNDIIIGFHSRLAREYNTKFNTFIDKNMERIARDHLQAFDDWDDPLIERLKDKLESYNPDLAEMRASINLDTEQIEHLESLLSKLSALKKGLEEKMDWKPVEAEAQV